MALNFLKKEINSKKRKVDEISPAPTDKPSSWVTRGELEREREKAYVAEQAKIDAEHRAVRLEMTTFVPPCCRTQFQSSFYPPMLTPWPLTHPVRLENG